MARGWESKSVEAQQDEAQRRGTATRPVLSDEQREAAGRRRTLELSRARAVEDLRRATSPHHRRMLERTIAALDDQLSRLMS